MQTTLVVVANVLREGVAKRSLCGKGDAARQLRLERVKERFGACVVAGAAHARTLFEPVSRDERTEGCHVLGAAIAMEDEAARWAATLQSPRQNPAGFARGPTAAERPGKDTARVEYVMSPTQSHEVIVADPKFGAMYSTRLR